MKKIHIAGVVVILLIVLIYGLNMKETSKEAVQDDGPKITFLGKGYTKAFTLPPGSSSTQTNESYEWTSEGEDVNNWSTLITTHKLSPTGEPLPADNYAQNVAGGNTEKGAIILETSVISMPEAAKLVDITNPPFLLVYIYPSSEDGAPAELGVQKIQGNHDGTIDVVVYSERVNITTDKELQDFIASDNYAEKRNAVISATLPY